MGFWYILTFMDGAKTTGKREATHNMVDNRSSAIPAAALPMIFAVAGAMSRRSDMSTN